jgi:hypothetical protein
MPPSLLSEFLLCLLPHSLDYSGLKMEKYTDKVRSLVSEFKMVVSRDGKYQVFWPLFPLLHSWQTSLIDLSTLCC